MPDGNQDIRHTIFLLSFEYPPHIGGIGEYSKQMSRAFHTANFDTRVYCTKGLARQSEVDTFDRLSDWHISRFSKARPKILEYILRILKFSLACKKHRPDMVIACDNGSAVLAWMMKIFFSTKYIVVGHGSEYLRYSRIYEFAMMSSECVVVNSSFTLSLLTKNFRVPISQTHVVTLGGDDEIYSDSDSFFTDKLRARFGIDKSVSVILTVGRVDNRKAQDVVVDALALMDKALLNNVIYIIVGRIVDDSQVNEITRKHDLEKNVILVGELSDVFLPAMYKLSDIYVQPSRYSSNLNQVEGFGIAICEASLTGVPVIGMKNSGMEDAIVSNVNGLLVAPDCVEELKEALEYLLRNREVRESMAKSSREYAARNLTWSQTGINTVRIVNEILANGVN